jgi:plasmid maintenance system antidote protein VapI
MGDLNDRHADHPGSFIEEMLEDRGWTQVDLARILGWDASQLDKLIKGETDVTLDAVVSLGNAFNLPAELFMDMREVHVTNQENDGRDLAERLPDIKKQIESFILDGTTKALAPSRIMDPIRRRELLIQNYVFASEMNSLDKNSTINRAKFHAFKAIDNAFITGVLIGQSIPKEVVTKILAAGKSVGLVSARRDREGYDEYADAKLTDAVAKAVGPGNTPPPMSNAYVRSIEPAVRDELKLADPKMIRKPAGWPKFSTIKKKVGLIALQRKGQRCQS